MSAIQDRPNATRREREAYWKASGPTLAGRGVKVLSVYTPFAILESMGPPLGARIQERNVDLTPTRRS